MEFKVGQIVKIKSGKLKLGGEDHLSCELFKIHLIDCQDLEGATLSEPDDGGWMVHMDDIEYIQNPGSKPRGNIFYQDPEDEDDDDFDEDLEAEIQRELLEFRDKPVEPTFIGSSSTTYVEVRQED